MRRNGVSSGFEQSSHLPALPAEKTPMLTVSSLNAAYQSMVARLSGAAPLPTTQQLMSQIQSCLEASSPSPALLAASVRQAEGFLAGIQGSSLAVPPPLPSAVHDVVENEWRDFIAKVRRKELNSRGTLGAAGESCADAFFAGAVETFPEAAQKPFLTTLSRLWARRMSPADNPLAFPVREDRLEFAREAGRRGLQALRGDYEAAIAGGLGKTVLDNKLHVRDVDAFLGLSGWYRGAIEFLRRGLPQSESDVLEALVNNGASVIQRAWSNNRIGYPAEVVEQVPNMLAELDQAVVRLSAADPEAARVLASNRGSVIYLALASGRLSHPSEAAERLPGVLRELDRKIADLASVDPKAAEAVRSNRGCVLHRTIVSGNFSYPGQVIEAVPAMLRELENAITRMSEPGAAQTLASNRASVVYRALLDGDLDYPHQVLERLPDLLRGFDEGVAALAGTRPEEARALAANRASIISRALASSDFRYPQNAIRNLPAVIAKLDRVIARFAASDPEAADALASFRPSVISRLLHEINPDYIQKLIDGVPKMLEKLKKDTMRLLQSDPRAGEILVAYRKAVIGRALQTGLKYPAKVAAELPKIVEAYDRRTEELRLSDPEASSTLASNRTAAMNRALRAGDLDYPRHVCEKVPGMLLEFDRACSRLSSSHPEAANFLAANRAGILRRALMNNDFDYPAKAAEGLPGLLRELDEAIDRLATSDAESSAILKANRATILYYTLGIGVFDYTQRLAQRLPGMLRELDDGIAGLSESDPAGARILSSHRGSVIYQAISRGNFDFPRQALEAVKAGMPPWTPRRS